VLHVLRCSVTYSRQQKQCNTKCNTDDLQKSYTINIFRGLAVKIENKNKNIFDPI
jgi:hypothetical protein